MVRILVAEKVFIVDVNRSMFSRISASAYALVSLINRSYALMEPR